MPLERKMSRDNFLPDEVVELKQICFTPGRVFQPGKYISGQLPDTAFTMGLVDKLPPMKGKNVEIGDPPAGTNTDEKLPMPSQRIEFGDAPPLRTDEEDGIFL